MSGGSFLSEHYFNFIVLKVINKVVLTEKESFGFLLYRKRFLEVGGKN